MLGLVMLAIITVIIRMFSVGFIGFLVLIRSITMRIMRTIRIR